MRPGRRQKPILGRLDQASRQSAAKRGVRLMPIRQCTWGIRRWFSRGHVARADAIEEPWTGRLPPPIVNLEGGFSVLESHRRAAALCFVFPGLLLAACAAGISTGYQLPFTQLSLRFPLRVRSQLLTPSPLPEHPSRSPRKRGPADLRRPPHPGRMVWARHHVGGRGNHLAEGLLPPGTGRKKGQPKSGFHDSGGTQCGLVSAFRGVGSADDRGGSAQQIGLMRPGR